MGIKGALRRLQTPLSGQVKHFGTALNTQNLHNANGQRERGEGVKHCPVPKANKIGQHSRAHTDDWEVKWSHTTISHMPLTGGKEGLNARLCVANL